MGAVWLAEHVMLGRPVAIKVLHREASVRPELVTRFFNEARAATAISDPGIIQIFDFGHHTDGNAYIVMELLEGEPLDQRLRRLGTMPLAASLRILRQVASSLGAAHRRGIIHRDLKPDNIFLVRDPEVAGGERTKILDFGIAKLSGDQHLKTQTSAVMGTPIFMSPEQCKGAGQVDQRSDVYSLGCVLFTLLIGRPPFDAEGAGEIIAMHLREAPPTPSSFMPGLPPAIDELILRCLAKNREQRFESGAELAAALEVLIEQLAPQLGTGAAAPRTSTATPFPQLARPPSAGTPPPAMGQGRAASHHDSQLPPSQQGPSQRALSPAHHATHPSPMPPQSQPPMAAAISRAQQQQPSNQRPSPSAHVTYPSPMPPMPSSPSAPPAHHATHPSPMPPTAQLPAQPQLPPSQQHRQTPAPSPPHLRAPSLDSAEPTTPMRLPSQDSFELTEKFSRLPSHASAETPERSQPAFAPPPAEPASNHDISQGRNSPPALAIPTPVPTAPLATPWPPPAGLHPAAHQQSTAAPQRPATFDPSTSQPTQALPRADAEDPTVAMPYVEATFPVARGRAPGGHHAGAPAGRHHQGAATTLSAYAVAGTAAKKPARRWWLPTAVVVTAIAAIVGLSQLNSSNDAGPTTSDASEPIVAAALVDAGSSVASTAAPTGSAAGSSSSASAASSSVPPARPPDAGPDAAAAVAVAPDAAPDAGAMTTPVPATAATPSTPREEGSPRTATNMHAVLKAFSKWATGNAGKPCPSISSFGLLLDAAEVFDAWGTQLRVTCTQQPRTQRIGVLSAGPDRNFGTPDDIASWSVLSSAALSSTVRGNRWVVESAPKPSRSPKKGTFVDKDGDGIPDNF